MCVVELCPKPPLDRHMPFFLLGNVFLVVVPVKNKVAGTKYWLKLSVLCDLLEIILYWAIQRSCFARVNVLCNLLHKKSREVAEQFWADF